LNDLLEKIASRMSCWWGGRPWPPMILAGTAARSTEIFQFFSGVILSAAKARMIKKRFCHQDLKPRKFKAKLILSY